MDKLEGAKISNQGLSNSAKGKTPLHQRKETAPDGCEVESNGRTRDEDASPKVANDLLAASQEWTGHLVPLGVPGSRWVTF